MKSNDFFSINDPVLSPHVYLKNILMNVPGSLYWKDKNGVYLGFNKFQADMAGISHPNDLLGKTDFELPWKEIAPYLRQIDQRIMESGVSEELIETPYTADGRQLVMLTSKSPLYDDQDNIIGIIGVSIDITDLKRAEARESVLLAEAEILKTKFQEEERLRQTMMVLAGAIAHEMRTPLMGILGEIQWLKKAMPVLLEAYNRTMKTPPPDILPIPPRQLEAMPGIFTHLDKTVRNAFTVIDMLLMNLKEKPLDGGLSICSINQCIQESLSNYYLDKREKTFVHWVKGEDFSFEGNSLLVQHVLFNLLKNGLFYAKKSKNPGVYIRTEITGEMNVLYFKDTGPGIDPQIVPHIFDRFFSKTPNGTGIGLSFCKLVMEGMGGQISCVSVLGEYTEFKLEFPRTM